MGTKDIPPNVVAVGNPCRVLRPINDYPDEDSKRVLEFGQRIRALYGACKEAILESAEKGYSLSFPEPALINHLILEEEMATGEHIESFRILMHPYSYGKPICIYQSSTVGHKHIATFPTVLVKKMEVEILAEDTPHTMKNISAHYLIKELWNSRKEDM